MLKIYQYNRSPFCIAVIQAARAGGIEPELIDVSPTDRSPIILKTNGAYYQVPLLEDGDRLIYETGPDSQDIAEYLDVHHLGGRLFPAATRGWQTIVNAYIENDVESVTFKVCDVDYIPKTRDVVERTMAIRHKERKFGVGCLERWTRDRDAMITEATRLLSPFEQTLTAGGNAFLFGAAPVYTDFLLYGILGNFTFENAAPFPPELPALHAWNERVRGFRY